MPRKVKRNRYVITRTEQWDIMDYANGNKQLALDTAISAVSERSRLYCMPATWTAHFDKQGRIIVTRYHY